MDQFRSLVIAILAVAAIVSFAMNEIVQMLAILADLRLVESNGLTCHESALTGESVPVTKTTEAVDAEAPLAERASMAFKGTAVTDGSGTGVVVRTGTQTELGSIAWMTAEADQEVTPLEERLDRLGRNLVVLTLVVAAVKWFRSSRLRWRWRTACGGWRSATRSWNGRRRSRRSARPAWSFPTRRAP